MAFTEAQKLQIVRIIGNGLNIIRLDDIIRGYDQYITAEVETAVAAELTRWATAGVDFVKVHPRERNLGAEIDPEREKRDIRKNIASLLFLDEYYSGASRIVRA